MSEHVEFAIGSIAGYWKLEAVTFALVMSKGTHDWKDEAFWLEYFDASARSHFLWPTPHELEDWRQRWFGTPAATGFTDPTLKTRWTFGSMINALENGDYDLLGCRKNSGSIGRFEFDPHGYPYGGIGCMRALIEAFGHRAAAADGDEATPTQPQKNPRCGRMTVGAINEKSMYIDTPCDNSRVLRVATRLRPH